MQDIVAKSRHAPRRQAAVKSDKASPISSGSGGGRGRRTVASLKRLEEAGLVEHLTKGVYTTVDQAPPPKPGWIEPLSGRHVARHAADGRVRDEMTMA
jgi:hypothetical protein